MNNRGRLNKVIDLLERRQVVFSGGMVYNGNLDDVIYMADSDYDFCIIEMEHEGFSFTNLRNSVQRLLSRKRIHESSGPHHQDSGEAKIRESTAGVSRKPSSDGKARGCSSKHLCGLTAWNT